MTYYIRKFCLSHPQLHNYSVNIDIRYYDNMQQIIKKFVDQCIIDNKDITINIPTTKEIDYHNYKLNPYI